jgi:peptidyl-prolyl cis-trans isomerase B (cyclophilin B)
LAKSNKSTLDSAKKSLKNFEAKQNVTDTRIKVRARDNRLAVIVTAAVILIASASQFLYFSFGPGVSPTACVTFTQTPMPSISGKPNPAQIPDAGLSECRDWTGTMSINKKVLDITLHGKQAPQAVANFVTLANTDGFYNGISCHRLTTAGIFVLQCGDPKADGTGGPGYSFGPIENAPTPASSGIATYKKGVLAMANSGGAYTNGSQFFIVYADSPLMPDYTVFGEITSGLNSLDPIIRAGVTGGGKDGKPVVETKLGAIKLN